MNKTVGSTLLVSGTMIGAGMLAMPLTSAGIGFTFTVILLIVLWLLLTYSALLFVEAYQTADHDAGIGTLTAQYFGSIGRTVSTAVLMVFLYALLAAYVTGGGGILMSVVPSTFLSSLPEAIQSCIAQFSIILFTIFFGAFVVVGTRSVDGFNRILFFAMLIALGVVLILMFPKISGKNLMDMPIDHALLISASPVFFTAFGFHGSIPSLNKYLLGNVQALRISIIVGSGITLVGYLVWQLSTHGVLGQHLFLEILHKDPTLNGLITACTEITGSELIGGTVKIFSALALITSFLGVALGLFECIEDLLIRVFKYSANRITLGVLTFLPPLAFALFYPEGFILALGYAGQMFAFYAVVLPAALVWKVRQRHTNLPYRVIGNNFTLLILAVLGIIISSIPLLIQMGYLPQVVG